MYFYVVLFLLLGFYKYNSYIKYMMRNTIIMFIWKMISFWNLFKTNSKDDFEIVNCFVYDNETYIKSYIPYVNYPIRMLYNYYKIEIVYKFQQKTYTYIEYNNSDKAHNVKFPMYSHNELMNISSESSVILAELIYNDESRKDITNILLQYQGPKKNFYKDLDSICHIQLSDIDIDDTPIYTDTVLQILDSDLEIHNFNYSDMLII